MSPSFITLFFFFPPSSYIPKALLFTYSIMNHSYKKALELLPTYPTSSTLEDKEDLTTGYLKEGTS